MCRCRDGWLMLGWGHVDGSSMSSETLKRRVFGVLGGSVGVLPVVLVGVVAAHAAFASVRAVTRSDATALATAISVRHGDLPTFKQQSNPVTPQQQRLTAQATSCAGGVPP